MSKPKLLLSFSGGETSGYMTSWCLENLGEQYDMEVVFANTGEEHEETLRFVEKCDRYFGFDVTWVEAVVHHNERKGCTHKIVDYKTASRDGEPFEDEIAKYGIPNQAFPHCTRELKTNPIRSYIRSVWGNDFKTAIGIRVDEIDRVSENRKENGFIYPLCEHNPTSKPEINHWWEQQPFRLNLKGYQGNCRACWKKSLRKLVTIAREEPSAFENVEQWEEEFGDYLKPGRSAAEPPFRFFRESRTVEDIFEMAENENIKSATDDSLNVNYQTSLLSELDTPSGCGEHCEPFAD